MDDERHWRRRGNAWVFEETGKAPTAFTQLAPSVQVHLPRGATLRLQMAVRARGGGAWTPDFDVGWQGAHRALPKRRLKGTHGTVDVDFIKLAKPARGWRLRLSTRQSKPWRWKWGLAGVTWRGKVRHAHASKQPRVEREVALRVPVFSQMAEGGKDGKVACSPTCIAMLLGHRGIEVDVPRAMRAAYDPLAKMYGNWQKNIEGAWALGCPGLLVFFRHWEQVAACLRAGFPLAASIKFPKGKLHLPGAPIEHSGGHLVVVRGLTPDGWVIVNDPAAQTREGVDRRYPLEPFSRAWFGFSGMGYLLLPPF